MHCVLVFVAARFEDDHRRIFDLCNEPHLTDVLPDGSHYWRCWLSGCTLNTVYGAGENVIPVAWQALECSGS